MAIPTKDIPQANSLDKVVLTVKAVSKGSRTYQEIAHFLDVTERQGAYYRRASEILGFIYTYKNNAKLTKKGKEFLEVKSENKLQIIAEQVIQVPVIQILVGMLASSGGTITLRKLEVSFQKVIPNTTPKMAVRRLSTILSWLENTEVIVRNGERISLSKIPEAIDKIEINAPDLPVLPKPGDLKQFHRVTHKAIAASKMLKFEVDHAKIERANVTHEKLRLLMAKQIKRFGALPTYNRYIDLAAHIDDNDFIIEAKSLGNVRAQIRRGISQLYEYRYLQSLPDATLILLLEKPLTGENKWLLDYLIVDRGICVVWLSEDDKLFTSEKCISKLPFLALKVEKETVS